MFVKTKHENSEFKTELRVVEKNWSIYKVISLQKVPSGIFIINKLWEGHSWLYWFEFLESWFMQS